MFSEKHAWRLRTVFNRLFLILFALISSSIASTLDGYAWTPPTHPNNKTKGFWNGPYQWHHDASGVHVILTPGAAILGDGSHSQLLYFYGAGLETNNQPRVWKLNPNDSFVGADSIDITAPPWNQNPKIPLVSCDRNLFCSGHAALGDGRILLTGGTEIGEGTAIDDVRYFNPSTRTFSPAPLMTESRWYPTNLSLGDGGVLTLAGSRYKQLIAFGGQDNSGAVSNGLGAVLGMRFQSVLDSTAVSVLPVAGRRHHSAVFDEANTFDKTPETKFKHEQRMVVFGGEDAAGGLLPADIWVLKRGMFSDWNWSMAATVADPTNGRPTSRSHHAAIYDDLQAGSGRMYLFGGKTGPSTLSREVWKLQLRQSSGGSDTWTRISNDAGIPARYGPGLIHQRLKNGGTLIEDRLVTFGGTDGTTYLNDTWKLITGGPPPFTGTWVQISPDTTASGAPPRRAGHAAVFDFLSNPQRLIIFGGWNGNTLFNDAWALTLPATGTPAWTKIGTIAGSNGTPAARAWSGGIYDLIWERLVLVGGDTSPLTVGGELGDVWSLPLRVSSPAASPIWMRQHETLATGPRSGLSAIFDDRWQEARYPERFSLTTGSWDQLEQIPKYTVRYPQTHLLPDGKAFFVAEIESTYTLDLGILDWSDPIVSTFDGGSSVCTCLGKS